MRFKIALFAMVLALLACGGATDLLEEPTDVPPTEAPAPTEAPTEAPAEPTDAPADEGDMGDGAEGTVTLSVTNNAADTMCYVRLSEPGRESYQEDLLAEIGTISTGGTETFTVAAGTYDLYAETCDETFIKAFDFDLSADATWTVAEFPLGGTPVSTEHGTGALLTVNNTSLVELCFVQISTTDSDTWGRDELSARQTVPPASSRVFEVAPGTYDIRFQFCGDGGEVEEYGVDVSTDTSLDVTTPEE